MVGNNASNSGSTISQGFYNYLNRFQTAKDGAFTHTSIRPGGKYYISATEEDVFFEKYITAMKAGDELTLTEKHRDQCPILIDIDLRFELETGVDVPTAGHKYTMEDVAAIIECYMTEMSKFVECEGAEIYLTEKPGAVVYKEKLKDGFHVVIPNIVTMPAVQHIVRKNILETVAPIFQRMGAVNTVEDIIDEAVIEKNNWQMYGSTKPGVVRYRTTNIFGWRDNTLIMTMDDNGNPVEGCEIGPVAEDFDDSCFVKKLSIRNKYFETPVLTSALPTVKEFQVNAELQAARKRAAKKAIQVTKNTQKNEITDLDIVRKLVEILDPKRAEDFSDWMKVGWCLRSIDHRLLDVWDTFSKNSSKYCSSTCETKWEKMRSDGGLGVGTLHMWAKLDNPIEYKKIVSNDLTSMIRNTIQNSTDYDVACVVHRLFQHRFRCSSIKYKQWYEFSSHRWVDCDSGYMLRQCMSNEGFAEYMKASQYYNMKATASEDPAEQETYANYAKKLNGVALKLKNTSFKDKILKECAELFLDSKFEEKLDSNTNLLCFNNGVYDLDVQEFREGRPEDYVSFTTGVNYEPYDPDNHLNGEIMEFLSKVLPNDGVREFVMLVLSSVLCGVTKNEWFHIWTGSGSNGKSKLIELFEKSIGNYSCKFNVSLLTQKRIGSNQTNSEIVRAKGKRFAVLQEPGENEKLNVGIMKELTGGDTIIARGLFKEPIEFKPQFKMVLTCNHLPQVPAEDGGTWRRIRLVEFTSKFCDNPTKENEFKVDTELSARFDTWKEAFLSMLIMYFKQYSINGIKEPEEVLKCTREYQRANDHMSDFIDHILVEDVAGFVTIQELFSEYKTWAREDNLNAKLMNRKDFEIYLEKNFAKIVQIQGKKGFKGYKISPTSSPDTEEMHVGSGDGTGNGNVIVQEDEYNEL